MPSSCGQPIPVGHHGGAGCVRLEEGQNLLTKGGIMTHVQIALGEPALENIQLVTFSENNADGAKSRT